MNLDVSQLTPGRRVRHAEFGHGVVIDRTQAGYLRVFFPDGERLVASDSLSAHASRPERIASFQKTDHSRLRRAWLCVEAHTLPLIEGSTALTAAPINLLPHQIVLTHRVATGSPRRYLIADEVGLGKTIEVALLMRELLSRGELDRALVVVPAGLVNNWHRELNEVFNLNFEVFGSEGDVTDRRSNAFEKHNRLIASIDTLKRRSRVRRIIKAPEWDFVVIDEAHHLTAYRFGKRIRKTENYKLAEALREHTRDMMLLSATPHQGDHFRFWMLVQLLQPTLFSSPEDMVDHRYRLNSVMFRRTKADACRPDGSPLFARRWVHTESFTMDTKEREFYNALQEYLREGFDIARCQEDSRGRALGFVMTIFQKIAASSFAAIHRTLSRRLMALTLHEAIIRDDQREIEIRDQLYDEIREMIRSEQGLTQDDAVSLGQIESILADLKVRLLQRLDGDDLTLSVDSISGDVPLSDREEFAADTVTLLLPEERSRIRALLEKFPSACETKIKKLLRGLGTLWSQNVREKIVVFATYLGTVDLIQREIDSAYPDQGVVVLRGGSHSTKIAAERRFRDPDGPCVLICTAAGREGINLQFSRVLFNFDLPWNPMDIEQRIGRIHRYGQHHTAQVYNLVLSDTIEGRIFLLLSEKLQEIALTLGKVDSHGNVSEDLRVQILGQLSSQLNYDSLFREALCDFELRRTKEELDAAMSNASEARKVVFELFQDLDAFSLDEYAPFSNVSKNLDRILGFLDASVTEDSQHIEWLGEGLFNISSNGRKSRTYTTDRKLGTARDEVELIGLDHPIIVRYLKQWQDLNPDSIGVCVFGNEGPSVVTWWLIHIQGAKNESHRFVQIIAVDESGRRASHLERIGMDLFHRDTAISSRSLDDRLHLLRNTIEPMLERDLHYRGVVPEAGGFTSTLIGWVEISSS